mgnify:FL=1
MSIRKNVIYYIKKNVFIVLVLIGLCPVLALSYAKFTINSESYRSNEMYISELLYSIKIDDENTYTIDIEPGETEHTIEITSLSGISTNYKLAYLNNDNLEVKYASDYMDASFGGIVMTRNISLTIKNTSTEKQTLSLMVFGGYSFNDVNEVKVLDTYTEILDDYWKYDYETTALYVDSKRVNELDLNKYYKLKSYTCNNGATVEYNNNTKKITVDASKQTKCSLYFEEVKVLNLAKYLIDEYQILGLTKIDQDATGNQTYATTEYRYQGANPNNYITFNDEVDKWRIVGVFEVQTPNGDGTYTKENKVKIVNDGIGTVVWNSIKTGTNYNDWTTATLMATLNSGDYYNRTGTYASNGLTDNAKNQISSTKWYLGTVTYKSGSKDSQGTYQEERSTKVYSGNKQTWDGKVALIYPSDYMYASSSCYNNGTIGYKYDDSTCKSTNWLLDTTNWFWTVSPSSNYSYYVMAVYARGYVNDYSTYSSPGLLRHSVYLSSSVSYISGDGSKDNPFVIE